MPSVPASDIHAEIDGRRRHLWRPEKIVVPPFVTFDSDDAEIEDYRSAANRGLIIFDEKNHAMATTLLGIWFSSLTGSN